MISSVAQRDFRTIASILILKICERRQKNPKSTGRTTVRVADMLKLFLSYLDPNLLETIIGQFGADTGFYEILGQD